MHVIGTAGHVDHGKSTLVETLTGIDPDRFDEEKRRGLTIDLGFAWLTLPSGREIGIIDVPGHERFIKNMLAGAGGISVCLFVVAANEGWKPQSAEHLAILDVLGIEQGVVAITKSDTVDETTLELVTASIRERLARTTLEGAALVPCSAKEGTGMTDLVRALDQVVEAAGPAEDLHRPRLWIDRVFTIGGAGTVVTGTLTGGHLHVGDAVALAPGGGRARIRAIQSHKKQLDEVGPGNRVALNLAGLARHDTGRGHAVVLPDRSRATSRVDALIKVLPEHVSGSRHDLAERGAHLLYSGSAETPVRISLLERAAVGPDETALARLWLRDPLPLVRGDRFVLRDAGRVLTFGGGRVIDPLPPTGGGRKTERVTLLWKLVAATPDASLNAIVEAEDAINRTEAFERSGATTPSSDVIELGEQLVSKSYLGRLQKQLIEELEEWHQEQPLEAGMSRESLRAVLGLGPVAFDQLLAAAEGIVAEGSRVRLDSFGVHLDPKQERKRRQLVEAIESSGFSPPAIGELAADPTLLRALDDAGELVRIGDFFLTMGQAEDAKARVRAAISSHGPMTVAQIRDLLGTTRKYAVPLCEWLDGTGATRRQGDMRVLGPNS